MTRPVFALAALALALTPALAAAQTGPRRGSETRPVEGTRQCFRGTDIAHHTIESANRIYVRTRAEGTWRIDFARPCRALTRIQPVLVFDYGGGPTTICKPVDINLRVLNDGAASFCIASAVAPLTREEAAALPRGLKP